MERRELTNSYFFSFLMFWGRCVFFFFLVSFHLFLHAPFPPLSSLSFRLVFLGRTMSYFTIISIHPSFFTNIINFFFFHISHFKASVLSLRLARPRCSLSNVPTHSTQVRSQLRPFVSFSSVSGYLRLPLDSLYRRFIYYVSIHGFQCLKYVRLRGR